MDKKRNMWKFLNLALFVASFVLFAINTYRVSFLITPVDTHHARFIGNDSPGLSVTRQQISEKNENEPDNDSMGLCQAELSLPFLCTLIFPADLAICQFNSPLVPSGNQAVYLLVHNLRI